MRRLPLALTLVSLACGRTDRAATPPTKGTAAAHPTSTMPRGTDQLVLRLPRAGGSARAFTYPALDSAIWTSTGKMPPVERILAFDIEGGSVAAVDTKGAPLRIDLRLGDVARDAKPALTRLVSRDGAAIYGLTADGSVVRLTPSGNWAFKPPAPVRDLVPSPDGSLLLVSDVGRGTTIWHVRPPETNIVDTAVVPRALRTVRTLMGDRLYFAVDSGLIGVRSKDLAAIPSIRLDRPVRAVTTTPSGDRIYIALDSTREIAVIDRYSSDTRARIAMPAAVGELRMDPLGRTVLARPVRGDSAWVIAIASDRIIGTVRTEWRDDLPTIAPDGAIVTMRGSEVQLLDPSTLKQRRAIGEGAKDAWLFVSWNGFRPRAKELDEPVTFGEDTTTAPHDTASAAAAGAFSGQNPRDSAAPPPADSLPAPAPVRASEGFTVQFAAVRDEPTAREAAQGIAVEGTPAHVITTERAGVTIYRVVLGPYPTRADAERVAKGTGKSFWIYEGQP